jgi:hypothetical protein
MRQHSGINLIWYSADLTLSRIAYVLEPDLNGRSYGAVYVTDDFGARRQNTGTSACYLSGDGGTLVERKRQSALSASTPTARGPGLTLSHRLYIVLLGQLTGPGRLLSNVVYYSADAGATFSSLNAATEVYTSLLPKSATTVASRCAKNQAEPLHALMTFQHSQPGGGL